MINSNLISIIQNITYSSKYRVRLQISHNTSVIQTTMFQEKGTNIKIIKSRENKFNIFNKINMAQH